MLKKNYATELGASRNVRSPLFFSVYDISFVQIKSAGMSEMENWLVDFSLVAKNAGESVLLMEESMPLKSSLATISTAVIGQNRAN